VRELREPVSAENVLTARVSIWPLAKAISDATIELTAMELTTADSKYMASATKELTKRELTPAWEAVNASIVA
jgi:hypothetical protein